jgi:hypothetical protein
MTGVHLGWYKLYLYKFSFNTKGDTSRCFVLQCTAASIKVEPCSDDEICSLSSLGEDEEEHLMPLFVPVMKCEMKASYILMSCPFCKSLYRQSFQSMSLSSVPKLCAQIMNIMSVISCVLMSLILKQLGKKWPWPISAHG